MKSGISAKRKTWNISLNVCVWRLLLGRRYSMKAFEKQKQKTEENQILQGIKGGKFSIKHAGNIALYRSYRSK